MTDNNGILLREILALEKSGELPQKVSNRLLLAGIIKNTNSISTLTTRETANEKEIGTLKKFVAFLSSLVLAMLGWSIFA